MASKKFRNILYPVIFLSFLNASGWCAEMETARDSIGEARMLEDGTIVLWLRAEGPNGRIGDGFLRYEPSDPKYREIKEHIGDIKPGESKPVPPWTK